MTKPARRLLGLLGVLPDGITHENLNVLLLREGEEAAWTLRRVGLAFDEGPRLRALQPIRDHARSHHPPEPNDLTRAVRHYRELATTLGPRVGRAGGAEAAARLAAEQGNLEAMLSLDLSSDDLKQAVEGILSLAEFLRFSGFGSTRILEAALSAAQRGGDSHAQARVLLSLGLVALSRSDHAAAQAHFELAQSLYEQVGDIQGQANCVHALGEMAIRRPDHAAGRARWSKRSGCMSRSATCWVRPAA